MSAGRLGSEGGGLVDSVRREEVRGGTNLGPREGRAMLEDGQEAWSSEALLESHRESRK